eukprot:TRINITY_DN3704_c0_g2_i2.p1 TRINITY_DN3704_c0_g2~~TRINITY_DN3704_c0_g2_i2.p1  ORF type:complete len:426 (-),score=92.98 TRINITY_DN3704_c0_g2_i2:46-1323(-)
MVFFVRYFKQPLVQHAISGKMGVTPVHLQQIFSNIEDIVNLNQRLLEQLHARISDWSDTQKIGDVFSTMTPFLGLYTLYSINFDTANSVYKELMERKDFRSFIEEVQEKTECLGLAFGAYLIMPIQRIPRYRMLMEDFLKNTSPDHEDHPKLASALAVLLNVAGKVNEAVAEAENRQKMLNVAKKFEGYKEQGLITPGRSFIMEGDLHKVCRKDSKKRTFFLFSDILLYTNPSSGKYKIGTILQLNQVSVEDVPEDTKGANCTFQIKSNTKSFSAIAPTPEDKAKWMTAITQRVDEMAAKANSFIQKKTVEAPASVATDNEVKACAVTSAPKVTITNKRQGGVAGIASFEGSVSETEEVPPICVLEALFDYQPASNEMTTTTRLPFKQGDALSILRQDSSGWWLAEMGDSIGWVPASYLEEPIKL